MNRPAWARGLRARVKRLAYLKVAQIYPTPARLKPRIFPRVLVLHLQAIGDWMVAVPALNALALKGTRIEVVACEPAASFLRLLPFIEQVHSPEKPPNEKYDALVDFLDTFTQWQRARLPLRIHADWRVGVARAGYRPWRFDECVEKTDVHMCEHAFRLLNAVAGRAPLTKGPFVWPRLPQGTSELRETGIAAVPDRLLIGLHIPNKNLVKRWPARSFTRLIELLDARLQGKAKFVLTGLESEKVQVAPVLAGLQDPLRSRVANLCGRLSPPAVIELVRSLDLLVTVDTSLLHIAAMTDTPTVALFGPTHLNYWATWGNNQTSLSVEVPCRPTEDLRRTLALDDRCCSQAENICLTHITPEAALEAALSVLRSDRGLK